VPPNQATIDAVREGSDLVELIRGRVSLVRRSGRWWGRCPFHEERTPSFSLLPPDFRRYYCHGCGATGDAIDWMREQEGAGSFFEAIEQLAERFGIPVEYSQEDGPAQARREARRRREQLLERAAAFYEKYLWGAAEAAPARDYLRGRGFEDELIRRYRIGYAPGHGAMLTSRALGEGFPRDLLQSTGLSRAGRTADFFVSRIMFPIADGQGRVQGFGGRTLDPGERAKYVNSPEGEHFKKRSLLFGLAEARAAAAREKQFVVAEGYTDVMGLAAAGVQNAVACMGTSLTHQQLARLQTWASGVKLCFDPDEAGERAAWRSVEAAKGLRLSFWAVELPPGRDPGDLAADEEGRRDLARRIGEAEPLVSSLIRSRVRRAGPSPRGRQEALDAIADLLRALPDDEVEKDDGVRLAASLLQLSQGLEERLRQSLRQDAPPASAAPRRELSPHEVRERRFLAMAVALPDAARGFLASLPPEAFEVEAHRRAFELLRAGEADLDAWPAELAETALAVRVELAEAEGVSETELREAAYRVELPMLRRRAAEQRAAGDEEGWLRTVDLERRVRAALRGEG
jgi:DNA primase